MDEFFEGNLFFSYETRPPLKHSDFVPFSSIPIQDLRSGNRANCENMNKKMVKFVRSSFPATMEVRETDKMRGYRHMISERLRRQRQKQSYLALHSLLPHGTKNDKNSIVQAAMKEIRELQQYKEELQRRNHEMEAKLGDKNEDKEEEVGSTKIRFKVDNPKSGIESMVEVLKCLKNMGSSATAIESEISEYQLLAVLDINTQVGADQVEKAVQRTLHEVERKFQYHSLDASKLDYSNILS